MKKTMLAAILLFTAPLSAQSLEVGLFAGLQGYRSSDLPGVSEPKAKPAYIGRLGLSLVEFGPASLQTTVGLHTATDSIFKTAAGDGTFHSHTHVSLGAMFNFKAVASLGAGIEYRFERLNMTQSGMSDATFNRPWARANVGMSFPLPEVKPFLGLEVAIPLVNKSAGGTSSIEDQIRSMAPKYQIGLYGGIRF